MKGREARQDYIDLSNIQKKIQNTSRTIVQEKTFKKKEKLQVK